MRLYDRTSLLSYSLRETSLAGNRIKAGVWAFLGTASVGGLIIVSGNILMALADSPEVKGWGNVLRQTGLALCVMTGAAFLFSQNVARLRRSARPWLQARTSQAAAPSPLLIALIRSYCVVLILFGTYACSVSVWSLFSFGFYQGGWLGLHFHLMVLSALLLVSPGFLIWGMTNAIIRIAQRLEEVSQKTNELDQQN